MARMDDKEQQRYQDTPASQNGQGSGKRGFVIALVALVIVLAVGFVAYNVLSSNHGASSTQNAGASAAATSGESASASSASSAQQGDAAQDLPLLADYDVTVYTEYGDARTLTQLADGKPFVMNFWATWCPFCIEEMDDFQKIVDEYDGRVSFAFIDVADGQRETVKDAAAWLLDNEYTLPAYYDTKLEASYAFGATGLPTTAVVNAAGEIVTIDAGKIDPERMRSLLNSLL